MLANLLLATLAASPTASAQHDLLIIQTAADGAWQVTSRHRVEAPLPVTRRARVVRDGLRFELQDARGRTLYADVMPEPRVVRAEFPPEGHTHGVLEGAHVFADRAFALRVPVLPDAATLVFLEPAADGARQIARVTLTLGGGR